VSKVRKTLIRIVSNDRTVYRDLKSYARTKASIVNRKVQHRVKGKTSDISTSINLAVRKRIEYGIHLLLDQPFYEKQTGLKFESHDAAMVHFKDIGQDKGFNPHPLFETKYYLAQSPKLGEQSIVEHYFETAHETRLSPSIYFDSPYYIDTYHWTHQYNPLGHFLSSGYLDKHNPMPFFDTGFYFQRYLKKMDGALNPVLHYITDGWRVGCNPHPMIDVKYLAEQIDPNKSLETFEVDPFLTFLTTKRRKIINPNPFFDTKYYKIGLQSDVNASSASAPKTGYQAMQQFLNSDTLVDPSPRFSERWYKEANPDIKELNGLYHYLRHGASEGRKIMSSMNATTNSQLSDAMVSDPHVVASHQDIIKATVVSTPRLLDPSLQAMRDLVLRRGDFVPDIIYLMPSFMKGGAEKYGAKLVNALAGNETGQNILVLTTDSDIQTTRDWIVDSDNLKVLSFEAKQLGLNLQQKTNLLSKFLMWCNPAIIINNNSHVGWEVYRNFGKALSQKIRLSATLFCYEFDKLGHKVGYARQYIRSTAEYLDDVFIDNSAFGPQLIKDFNLGPVGQDVFRVLHQPIEGSPSDFANISVESRPRVLWAARFVAQKNVALLREIALEMPDVDFILWSIGSWNNKIAGGSIPKNVTVIEESTTFEDMAQRDFSAFLLTSDWEGLPTTLIEATLAGLPIVSSNIGGAMDIVTKETGWSVQAGDKASFIEALTECLADRALAEEKVKLAQKHILKQHSQASYIKTLKSYGLLPAKPKVLKLEGQAKVKSTKASKPVSANAKSKPTRLAKTSLDATVVVNGHKEGHYILPTLSSTLKAFLYAKEQGYSCEYLIALDNPDEITEKICRDFAQKHKAKILMLDVKDLGLARNEAARAARGEYVVYMDGDDMMTDNWITQGIRTGREYGPDVVMHPAMNYIFGNGDTYIYLHRDMEDPEFSLAALIIENYWTALSMARRDLYLKYPYDKNALKQGLAYEDWSWNALTIANGVKHKIVHDTAHFIRRKPSGSLLQQTVESGALPRLYHLKQTHIQS